MENLFVFLDDFIAFSKSKKDHLAHVSEALTLLGNAGLSLKLKNVNYSPKRRLLRTYDPSGASRRCEEEHYRAQDGSPTPYSD
jgi:hypothetical protein